MKVKKGYSHKYYMCPDCSNIMRNNTLTQTVSIKQWAQWAYAGCKLYWKEGYYKKIKFDKLFGRLKDLGISYEFWKEWRRAKEMTADELRKVMDDYYTPTYKKVDLRNIFYEIEINEILGDNHK